jgi:hypothetical protein
MLFCCGSEVNARSSTFVHAEAAGVPIWLVNPCFIGDTTTKATTELQWRAALPSLKKELGLADGTIPLVVDVLLPLRPRSELVGHAGS